MDPTTREGQYQACIEDVRQHGFEFLGLQSSESWRKDPRHLLFNLSRYKFVAKMLAGAERALEVGCGDAFGTRIVRQEVQSLVATDFDPIFIEEAKLRSAEPWPFRVVVHDFSLGPFPEPYDAVYALDVLEHVPQPREDGFMKALLASLEPHGVAIIGMPSLESQAYASEISKRGHVNCKSMPDLKAFMKQYFHNIFMFSMNDEVVHTGYYKMAHYLFAVGCSKRRQG
jgi:2-polyprenyl-3-methyl-5-hydroxy-6-metoxy-1,4-benzoquinol methylase